MKLVIDASVALKWFFAGRGDEADGAAAMAILRSHASGSVELLQPPHFMAEMCAVLAREAPRSITRNLRDLLDLAIPVRDDAAVYARAMLLSRDLGHHLFDTLYHAVALETDDALLLTADAAYARKARHLGRLASLAEWRPTR